VRHAVPGQVIGAAAAKAIAAGVATTQQAGVRDMPLQESECHLQHGWSLGKVGTMSGGSANRGRALSVGGRTKNELMFKIASRLI
jgi:hypothetical protein